MAAIRHIPQQIVRSATQAVTPRQRPDAAPGRRAEKQSHPPLVERVISGELLERIKRAGAASTVQGKTLNGATYRANHAVNTYADQQQPKSAAPQPKGILFSKYV